MNKCLLQQAAEIPCCAAKLAYVGETVEWLVAITSRQQPYLSMSLLHPIFVGTRVIYLLAAKYFQSSFYIVTIFTMQADKQTSCSFKFKRLILVFFFSPLASCLYQIPINQMNEVDMQLKDTLESPDVKAYGVGVDFSASSMYESHLEVPTG